MSVCCGLFGRSFYSLTCLVMKNVSSFCMAFVAYLVASGVDFSFGAEMADGSGRPYLLMDCRWVFDPSKRLVSVTWFI